MGMRRVAILSCSLACLLTLASSSPAQAAEIKVMASTAVRTLMQDLIPKFEKATGHTVVIEYGVANVMVKDMAAGKPFDLALLMDQALDSLVKSGKIAAGSRTLLAKMGVAVGIHTGGRKYDIGTVDAFRRMLMDAKAIAYSGPGTSGVYFAELLKKLGLDQTLKPKLVVAPSGDAVGEAIATGKAEIGILPAVEILPVAGAEVLGEFPEAIQSYAYSIGGISVAATQAAAAKQLLDFIVAPANRPVILSKGLTPVD